MSEKTYCVPGSPYHMPDYIEDYKEPTDEEIKILARKAELDDPFGINTNTYRKAV